MTGWRQYRAWWVGVVCSLMLTTAVVAQPTAPDTPGEAELARQIEAHLRQQILAPVFPRVVDRRPNGGGFFQEFDRQWRQGLDRGRTIVFQGRMTWTAGRVAADRADLRERFAEYARHGARFLMQVMWDLEGGGGFWWRVDPDFRADPTVGKMTYGQAFGLYALAAAYAGTRDAPVLERAKEAYRWLETYARDRTHGGYFEVLERDGRRRGTPGERTAADGGWPVGLKTSNTSLHVLEAYSELCAVWPDEQLRADLRSLVELFRDKMILETGHLGADFFDDWRVENPYVSWGHDVEAAHLLLVAAEQVGLGNDAVLAAKCRRMVDLALENGWDPRLGGLYENREGLRRGVAVGPKEWWPQGEMLLALAVMHQRYGSETPKYLDALRLQWRALTRQFTDPQYPGRIGSISADGRVDYRKLHEWKAIYHDVRCLMRASDILGQITPTEAK